MKNFFLKTMALLFILVISSCKTSSKKEVDPPKSKQENSHQQNREPKRPSPDEIFTKMDTNKDDKLAKSEVEGPLKNDFSKIDTDEDGFITKEELQNAPKPERKGPEHK